MKTVSIGSHRFTKVVVLDEPGQGNACHSYAIAPVEGNGTYGSVTFQNGPIKEFGVNGCHHEDLLAIVIHRLESFQAGEYACRENALALTKLEEAMHWLNHRTAKRQARGVEGTSEK